MSDLGIAEAIGAAELASAYPRPHPPGSRPSWSPEELALLRAHYARLGPAALAAYLPARTVAAITEVARKQGLHHYREYHKQPPSTPQLDAAIRRLYAKGPPEPGTMRALCERFGRPRQWVRARGIMIGACQPWREPNWSQGELDLLAQHEGKGTRYVQRALLSAGYSRRTEPAIAQRMRGLGLMVMDRGDLFNAHDIAKLLGLDGHVVLGWIKRGHLKARREDSASDGVTVPWRVTRRDLRAFLVAYPGEWWPGRCDRYWLVELLANP